jgi:hypothetical protein
MADLCTSDVVTGASSARSVGPRASLPVAIRVEQAVYGSFAFRSEGYTVLARSPGCREEWVAEFRAACCNLGERPAGAVDAPGLFALRLPSGPWAVVGVSSQGVDNHGRPGARAFHGLFISSRDYRRAGADPFAFLPWLRDDWTAETRELSAERIIINATPIDTPVAPRAAAIAAALGRRRRVALESSEPIDGLAEQVWHALPRRVRMRLSVATWTFSNANHFDLLAVPRLAAITLDSSYVDPSSPMPGRGLRRDVVLAALGAGVLLAAVVLRGERAAAPRPLPTVAPSVPIARVEAVDPAERRRVVEALAALDDRFGEALETNHDRLISSDPVVLMERIARDLRYSGPWLTPAALARLEVDSDSAHDAALARRWDALIHRFAPDRPLPDDFPSRSLASQVEALAWSFHLENSPADATNGPRPSPSEVVQTLGEWLTADCPVRPLAQTARAPALAAYHTFLGRLPRR